MTARRIPPGSYHPWTTYIYAREEARARGDRRVGTEHLVLGLLYEPVIESLIGTDPEAARRTLDALERAALRAVGISAHYNVPAPPTFATPPKPTLKAVLQRRLALTPGAKVALQEAGRPIHRGRQITAQEVLVRLLDREPPDPGAVLLAALGVDRTQLRERLVATPDGTQRRSIR